MTKQEFARSYQLLRQVTRGDVQTHHALASTGAVVMVHRLEAEATTAHRELISLIERLGPDDRQRILLVDDIDGAPFIVTRFLLEFTTLRAWLEAAARAAAPAPTAPEVTPPPEPRAAPPLDAPPERQTSEFTRMFRALDVSAPAPDTPSKPASEPGEFTRMFPAASASRPSEPLAAAPATPPPTVHKARSEKSPLPEATADAAASNEPGEFTRVFGAPQSSGASKPAQPGELTSAFGAPQPPPASSSRPAEPESPSVSPVPPTPARAPAEPGEFTKVFGAPTPPEKRSGDFTGTFPSASPPAPSQSPQAGEFTRVFGAPQPQPSPPAWGAPPPPAPSWGTAKGHGDDDYFARLSGTAGSAPPMPSYSPEPPVYPPSAGAPSTPPAPGSWNLDLPKPPPPPPAQGEFTRIMSAPAVPQPFGTPSPQMPAAPPPFQMPAGPPPFQMPAPPQPPKVPVKPPSRVPLIVGLAIVVLATIGALILLIRAAD